MADVLKKLADIGVSIWLDDLSRHRIESGDLARFLQRGVVGITTNPTIFAKAIGLGLGYENQVHDLALRGAAVGESVRLLTGWDVRMACDLLSGAAGAPGGRDGRVSIEVDPRISQDAMRTAAEARALWWLIDRPNLYIKIPATLGALAAITEMLATGISVNVTLIFSIGRYQAVLDAFMRGLEQRLANGGSLECLESVASFFVSRVDVEIDDRLDQMIGEMATAAGHLRGKAAIANARLAYEVYERARSSPRWQALERRGGNMQRLLWASTAVKDKAYDDTRYVVDLAAPDTINTMPAATLDAVEDHGRPHGNAIAGTYDAARQVFEDLKRVGIDIEEVAIKLEEQGLTLFSNSWNELIASVRSQLEMAGAQVTLDGAVKPVAGNGDLDSSAPAAASPA